MYVANCEVGDIFIFQFVVVVFLRQLRQFFRDPAMCLCHMAKAVDVILENVLTLDLTFQLDVVLL